MQARAGALNVLRHACQEMSPGPACHICQTILLPTCKVNILVHPNVHYIVSSYPPNVYWPLLQEVFKAEQFSSAVRKEAGRLLSQLLLVWSMREAKYPAYFGLCSMWEIVGSALDFIALN